MINPLSLLSTRLGYLAVLLTFGLSGCLPSSCSKKESRDLTPADSLSRAFALTIPVDTLTVLDSLNPEEPDLKYPLSLRYRGDGTLWVGDAGGHSIMGFSESGEQIENIQVEGLEYPYVAGFRADSLVIFTPADPRVLVLVDGVVERTFPVPDDRPSKNGLQYLTTGPDNYYYKVIDDDFDGYIAALGHDGTEKGRVQLEREHWRYAGALRMWQGSLVSLSGYLPQIHKISGQGSSMKVDTLGLKGFDSPMLSRTRQFILDDLSQPPLLSSAAASVDERLFVLNMRPGWLRIDVYDPSGKLEVVLTQPNPAFNTEYFPSDIAVRRVGNDFEYEFAITLIEPEGRVDRFRWTAR